LVTCSHRQTHWSRAVTDRLIGHVQSQTDSLVTRSHRQTHWSRAVTDSSVSDRLISRARTACDRSHRSCPWASYPSWLAWICDGCILHTPHEIQIDTQPSSTVCWVSCRWPLSVLLYWETVNDNSRDAVPQCSKTINTQDTQQNSQRQQCYIEKQPTTRVVTPNTNSQRQQSSTVRHPTNNWVSSRWLSSVLLYIDSKCLAVNECCGRYSIADDIRQGMCSVADDIWQGRISYILYRVYLAVNECCVYTCIVLWTMYVSSTVVSICTTLEAGTYWCDIGPMYICTYIHTYIHTYYGLCIRI